MGMILRIASSRIVGQGDIVGRSGYFSLNLSANSVMRGRLDARRTLKSLVADLRLSKTAPRIPAIMPNTLEAADYRPDRFIFSLRSANSRIKSAVPSIPSTEESMQRW